MPKPIDDIGALNRATIRSRLHAISKARRAALRQIATFVTD
jgi:hypothetical protein